jgi:Holliday junction resolvase RusA-like endonuclease
MIVPTIKRPAIVFTIRGEAASKANSRKIVTLKRDDDMTGETRTRLRSIKSAKARAFTLAAFRQIPARYRLRLAGPLRVTIGIWYASARPDLDESVVLDALQDHFCTVTSGYQRARVLIAGGVYRNDRQIVAKTIYKGIDRDDPRVVVKVEPVDLLDIAHELDALEAASNDARYEVTA